MDYTIHWLPVLIIIVINLIIGSLWYSPKMFSGYWVRESNIKPVTDKAEMQRMMMKGMIFQIFITGIEAVIYHALMHGVGVATLGDSLKLSLALWLGFVVPSFIGMVIWEGKPWGLFFLHVANQLLNLLIIGLVYSLVG
ncbi:MAG: hypothetical protein JWN89_231 [Parcubacteria group bacterium]|nr:hypothetical protein [Parcubacteria group bacterium]